MSLDLRNFVQVNINYHSSRVSSVERGIVTLITKADAYSGNPLAGKIFWSYSDYIDAKAAAIPAIIDTSLDPFVASFFANKGKGLQIVGGFDSSDPQDTIQAFLLRKLKELDYRFVIITSDALYTDLLAVAKMSSTTNTVYNAITDQSTVSTFEGINEKIFISSLNSDTPESIEITDKLPNFVLKYGRKGIEMLAAAYLSAINFRSQNGISDYNFTIENLEAEGLFDFKSPVNGTTITELPTAGSLIVDNDTGVHLMNEHVNFDTILVNNNRNLSGDTLKGEEVVNYYTKIILTQTLTERILTLLVSKLKYNQTSINRVMNAITQELNNYVSNGYLQPGYIWAQDPLLYNYNGVDYQVCARNEVLQKGYKSIILPITALSEEERNEHVFPPVYVLLADQRAIRMIVITGDIY